MAESDAPSEFAPARAGNLIIWLLVLSTAGGIFLELLGFILIGLPIPVIPELIVIPLTIYLAYVDQRKLEATGHDTSRMGPPWLLPIYLFKRARILKSKFTYFIVWCALWVVLILL